MVLKGYNIFFTIDINDNIVAKRHISHSYINIFDASLFLVLKSKN